METNFKKEKDGGFNPYFKCGIGYDSRDKESFASKGIWTELLYAYSPGGFKPNNFDYSKITFYHRQYINLYQKKPGICLSGGMKAQVMGNNTSLPFATLEYLGSYIGHPCKVWEVAKQCEASGATA